MGLKPVLIHRQSKYKLTKQSDRLGGHNTNLKWPPDQLGNQSTNLKSPPDQLGDQNTNLKSSPDRLGEQSTNLKSSPDRLGKQNTNLQSPSTRFPGKCKLTKGVFGDTGRFWLKWFFGFLLATFLPYCRPYGTLLLVPYMLSTILPSRLRRDFVVG